MTYLSKLCQAYFAVKNLEYVAAPIPPSLKSVFSLRKTISKHVRAAREIARKYGLSVDEKELEETLNGKKIVLKLLIFRSLSQEELKSVEVLGKSLANGSIEARAVAFYHPPVSLALDGREYRYAPAYFIEANKFVLVAFNANFKLTREHASAVAKRVVEACLAQGYSLNPNSKVLSDVRDYLMEMHGEEVAAEILEKYKRQQEELKRNLSQVEEELQRELKGLLELSL